MAQPKPERTERAVDEYPSPIRASHGTPRRPSRTARWRVLAGAAGIGLLGAFLAQPAATGAPSGASGSEAQPPPYRVIAEGLDNPRHLSFSSGGALYVAESGKGGDGPCIPGPEGGEVCLGSTGAITKVTHSWRHWRQRRVVKGLPSLAGADGTQAGGPSDVEVRGHHTYVISLGLGADPARRSELGWKGRKLGTLLKGTVRHHAHRTWHHRKGHHRTRHHRHWRILADIARHEARTNPVDDPDSNPASVVRVGRYYLVADAGGNTVVAASHHGRVRTVATFPDGLDQPPPLSAMQFVPTAAVVGPDGALYVSQLTGFPFPHGGSKIYRIVPGRAPQVYARGLTNVTDLAFGRDGSLYAVEISAAGLASGGPPVGDVVKVATNGSGSNTVVAGGLFAPYGIALRHGSAYVTTGSILPDSGEVVRIPLSR